MKARPILFSAPMVRALLDGSKTQTRRIVKPQPERVYFADNEPSVQRMKWKGTTYRPSYCLCPYGVPGDLLWVRETWGLSGDLADLSLRDYRIEDPVSIIRMFGSSLKYRADRDGYDEATQSWRPSIHMPRWASRLTLRITDVRVERVRSLSRDDAKAEGVRQSEGWTSDEKGRHFHAVSPIESFRHLWTDINGPDAWSRNDWVWVVSFDVLKQNVDDVLGEAA